MPRKRVTLRNRGLGILLFNLRLLIGTLRETPFYLMQLFTTPT